MPKFSQFKTTNNRLRTQSIYHTCRKLLTTTELANHNSDIRILYKQLKHLQNSNDFFNIPSNDLNSIYHVLDNQVLKSLSVTTRKINV
jgi:hypothetical protein